MTMVISILLFLSYIGASTAIRLYLIKTITDYVRWHRDDEVTTLDMVMNMLVAVSVFLFFFVLDYWAICVFFFRA